MAFYHYICILISLVISMLYIISTITTTTNEMSESVKHYIKDRRAVNDTLTLNEQLDVYKFEHLNDVWLNRSDSIDYRDYGDGSCAINKDRPGFQKLFTEWKKIANDLSIRYFISSGSLLGAWRDEEVIPYDQDIDLRVHLDDFSRLYPIREQRMKWNSYDDHRFHIYITKDWEYPLNMRRRFSCAGKQVLEYEGQCSFTDPYARLIYRQWHLDIYVYTHYHKTLKFIPDGGEFLKENHLPTVKCKFMGLILRCPKNPKIFLDAWYSGKLKPSRTCKQKLWANV